VRERCERAPNLLLEGPGYVLYVLMDTVVDRYFPVIDTLEAKLEKIEALLALLVGRWLAADVNHPN